MVVAVDDMCYRRIRHCPKAGRSLVGRGRSVLALHLRTKEVLGPNFLRYQANSVSRNGVVTTTWLYTSLSVPRKIIETFDKSQPLPQTATVPIIWPLHAPPASFCEIKMHRICFQIPEWLNWPFKCSDLRLSIGCSLNLDHNSLEGQGDEYEARTDSEGSQLDLLRPNPPRIGSANRSIRG